MNNHISKLMKLGIINTNFTLIDSAPIFTSTKYNVLNASLNINLFHHFNLYYFIS